MKTIRDFEWSRRLGAVTVPAGTRVEPCKDGTGQFWVCEFGWLRASSSRFYLHDAQHYGIRVDADNVSQ